MAIDKDLLPYLAVGGGAAAAGLGSMMGNYQNPSDAAMPYLNKIPGEIERYAQPYVGAGNRAIPRLENQYKGLLTNPGQRLNEIGGGYQQSPGFKFALNQALTAAGNRAASGGMAGSPQHQYQNMEIATGLGNQDYNNWIQNALGLYHEGLGGEQNMFNTGAATSMGVGQDLASVLAHQAQLAYEGQNSENQHEGGTWGSIAGGIGAALPAIAAFL